jgi:putative PIN family toxin of toxin-antitoxin system
VIAVCLDTNVLVSGIVGSRHPKSTPGAVYRAWRDGAFILVVSEHILDEAARTLAEPYFRARLTPEETEEAVRSLRRRSRVTSLTVGVTGVASHHEDDLILATAVSGRADFLVTGDAALRGVGEYRGVTILGPRAFLEALPLLLEERGG